jgi:hypothetical protein
VVARDVPSGLAIINFPELMVVSGSYGLLPMRSALFTAVGRCAAINDASPDSSILTCSALSALSASADRALRLFRVSLSMRG